MTTDWQLQNPYDAGYEAGFAGKSEEFNNPYWQSGGDEETAWLRGFAHGSMSAEFSQEVYADERE